MPLSLRRQASKKNKRYQACQKNSIGFKMPIRNLMATSINRLLASRVFRNHRVSKRVFVIVKLLRVTKRLSSVAKKKKKYYSANLRFDGWKLSTRLPSTIPTHQNANWPNNNIFVATEEGQFATRSNLTVTKTPFETKWLRKTPLATSRFLYYPAMPLGNRKTYFRGSFQFSIVTIRKISSPLEA